MTAFKAGLKGENSHRASTGCLVSQSTRLEQVGTGGQGALENSPEKLEAGKCWFPT